jgi:hypothetical protein
MTRKPDFSDVYLNSLVTTFNSKAISMNITVLCGGFLITGYTVSEAEFIETLGHTFDEHAVGDVIPDMMHNAFRSILAVGYPTPNDDGTPVEESDGQLIYQGSYLHLKNPYIWADDGFMPMPLPKAFPYCRLKVDQIIAWTIGVVLSLEDEE